MQRYIVHRTSDNTTVSATAEAGIDQHGIVRGRLEVIVKRGREAQDNTQYYRTYKEARDQQDQGIFTLLEKGFELLMHEDEEYDTTV